MKFSSVLALVSTAALTEAVALKEVGFISDAAAVAAGGGACPAVWTQVSAALTKMFLGSDGQCTDLARAAIRASFHDCGTWNKAQGNTGGCDGSLFLSAEENSRSSNRGLQTISAALKGVAAQYKVGVADIIAFAGAHATVTCPLGPTCKTMIGRKDSANPGPDALLPASANLSATDILALMADKGFNGPDTAALVGAHSSSKQFFADVALAGAPQDTTPGIWDVAFYGQTTSKPAGVFVFASDASLAASPVSGPTFKSFVGQQAQWNSAFADTFARLTLLGVANSGLIDCTSALPAPRDTFAGANPATAPGPSSAAPPAPGKSSPAPVPATSKGNPSNGVPTPTQSRGQGGRPTGRPDVGTIPATAPPAASPAPADTLPAVGATPGRTIPAGAPPALASRPAGIPRMMVKARMMQ